VHPLDHARRLVAGTGPVGETAAFLARGVRAGLGGTVGGLAALCPAEIAREAGKRLCVVVPDLRAGHDLVADLESLGREGGPSPAVLLPPLDSDPYSGVAAHPDTLRGRVRALAALVRHDWRTLVVPARSLAVPLPPPGAFAGWILTLHREEEYEPARLRAGLTARGYDRQDTVASRGEFASRGFILDAFPPDAEVPLRLEFFGDTVTSIRPFDPATQRSLAGELEEIHLPPMREFAVADETPGRWAEAVAEGFPATGGEQAPRDERIAALAPQTDRLSRDATFAGYELMHWVEPKPRAGLEDYLGDVLRVVLEPEACRAQLTSWYDALEASYEHRVDEVLPPPSTFLLSRRESGAWISEAALHLNPLGGEEGREHRDLAAAPSIRYQGDIPRFAAEARQLLERGGSVGVVVQTRGGLDRLAEVLEEQGLLGKIAWMEGDPPLRPDRLAGRITLGLGRLRRGFQLEEGPLLLVTDRDLQAAPPRPRERRRAVAAETFLPDLRELREGDLVVHTDHGIGFYAGITTMPGPAGDRDFMIIEYQGKDRLYQPLERLDVVQKYSGVAGVRPKVDRMGGASWKRVKSKIRKSMREMTKELLELYARRMTARGHAFGPDQPWQEEFEEAFPFEETPDQVTAIQEVKEDMEEPRPMDRLLVGDVGYGKTEVAMRAVMKAVLDGKQAAVLAPTTVLTFQHHRTFTARFQDYPVRIDLLSRFRSRAEQGATLEALALGEVDIVIGTHRLLVKDVVFKDLGLLVVDEEQRFGVRHKERIKSLKKDVDVLTLTATPIPRTLQMALFGLREMSLIRTPPAGRYAIQTEVLPFRKETIRLALAREIERGGQVYFVHNRVGSIYSMARLVEQLAPGARVVVAHGQMADGELEKTILAFVRGEAQVLVTTTIIENGVDIPRVNTIVVNRADQFGLAQLYQLRGRVGRGREHAFAYLLVPGMDAISEVARKRLRALKEFSQLGSGFRLAAQDLEIRGAGNLLGAQQSGHIAAVGFEMYCRLLERAAAEMRGEDVPEEFEVNVSLPLDLHLPETYVPDQGERLGIYKRIVSAARPDEVDTVVEQVADRYGHPPGALGNLALVGKVRVLAQRLQVSSVEGSRRSLVLKFPKETKADLDALLGFLREEPGATLSPDGVLEVPLGEGERASDRALELLEILA